MGGGVLRLARLPRPWPGRRASRLICAKQESLFIYFINHGAKMESRLERYFPRRSESGAAPPTPWPAPPAAPPALESDSVREYNQFVLSSFRMELLTIWAGKKVERIIARHGGECGGAGKIGLHSVGRFVISSSPRPPEESRATNRFRRWNGWQAKRHCCLDVFARRRPGRPMMGSRTPNGLDATFAVGAHASDDRIRNDSPRGHVFGMGSTSSSCISS